MFMLLSQIRMIDHMRAIKEKKQKANKDTNQSVVNDQFINSFFIQPLARFRQIWSRYF